MVRWTKIALIVSLVVVILLGCRPAPALPTPTVTLTPVEPSSTPAPTETPKPTAANPSVALSPVSGPPGTELQVSAAGFPAQAEITLALGPRDTQPAISITARADAEGRLSQTMAIPSTAKPGEEWVVVATTPDGEIRDVSNFFEVIAPDYQPTVNISPTSGTPGTQVQIMAQGFPPDVGVDVGIGRVNSEYDVIATAQTDARGRVEAEITIPAFVEPEDSWVIVVAAQSGGFKAVSDEFDVTAESEADEVLFTRTNIFLIAVGDAGSSGKEIGCGDSVIPVEVVIEPTIAPLTEALNELFALDSREYGQSGLYNALYRSDLIVEGIDIENREAIIALSGEVVVGGTCDIPRVKAQLRQTALQYDTIDSVSIFVNDQPLDEVLSLQNGDNDE
jgi:hypothetical protein